MLCKLPPPDETLKYWVVALGLPLGFIKPLTCKHFNRFKGCLYLTHIHKREKTLSIPGCTETANFIEQMIEINKLYSSQLRWFCMTLGRLLLNGTSHFFSLDDAWLLQKVLTRSMNPTVEVPPLPQTRPLWVLWRFWYFKRWISGFVALWAVQYMAKRALYQINETDQNYLQIKTTNTLRKQMNSRWWGSSQFVLNCCVEQRYQEFSVSCKALRHKILILLLS